nr:MAG TPA: hypothetical protein [Microviridae sp.]
MQLPFPVDEHKHVRARYACARVLESALETKRQLLRGVRGAS